MKKDIKIPKSAGIYMGVAREKSEEFQTMEWNAYLINDRDIAIEMVLIVSKGFDKEIKTATMRHSVKVLAAKSFAKIEFLQEELLQLTNEFAVTYFADGKMYERTFVFSENSIKESGLVELPIIKTPGILCK
ncbi:hypothetical protein [Gillisia limnaea]|uniref:Phenylalanyl-tRNA synthetase subunit alpha n=1 Tax=Gillisia limnaea (strain DSM 15749 / LMG 21470 / R-8282) TaxID=865937 RepID=H2BUX2_GILLR|nr:hypothetical protein [Gillisia limnaea]EHQ02820.1 hypothetical protein Gilli_2187 [Gillisia limnaea DSM 15749]